MINGGCALSGSPMARMKLKSRATTERREFNMAKLLDEIHPGEILLEEFMQPLGITAQKLAADIDVPPSRVSEIVNGRRPITADTAVRLSIFFGMDARYWLNLQSEYDVRVAKRTLTDKIMPRIRVFHHPMGAGA
jgi:addiction module HigA family antidote